MKFRIEKQIVKKELLKIVARQCKDKDLFLHKMSDKQVKQLSSVRREISKRGVPKKFLCRKLGKKVGHGIFLHPEAEPILRGEVIGPYTGVVTIVPEGREDLADYAFDPIENLLLTREEQKKFDPENRYHPRRRYALKLDALKKGCFTRFINHSEVPNVEACLTKTQEEGFYELVYIAKRRILPGEQLLISYEDGEKSYWDPLGKKPFPMSAKTFQINTSLQLISQKPKRR